MQFFDHLHVARELIEFAVLLAATAAGLTCLAIVCSHGSD